MATYIVLANFTKQGIEGIKDSAKRRAAGREVAKALGGEIVGGYMTMGRYDLVLLVDLPDDGAAAKFALRLGQVGNLQTETMRAFGEGEMDELISAL